MCGASCVNKQSTQIAIEKESNKKRERKKRGNIVCLTNWVVIRKWPIGNWQEAVGNWQLARQILCRIRISIFRAKRCRHDNYMNKHSHSLGLAIFSSEQFACPYEVDKRYKEQKRGEARERESKREQKGGRRHSGKSLLCPGNSCHHAEEIPLAISQKC